MQKIKIILKRIPFIFNIKEFFDNLKKFVKYIYATIRLGNKNLSLTILSNEETVKLIKENKMSAVRYGDGEFMYISGKKNIAYQKYNEELKNKLSEILNIRKDNLLICLPEPLCNLNNLVKPSKWHWKYRIYKDFNSYRLIKNDYVYGNSFISRPYIVYKNKKDKKEYFDSLKTIWDSKEVILIEGKHSCSGVGNDLFLNCKSLKRIICPDRDAYTFYREILNYVKENIMLNENILFLIALGPTAKPLVVDLNEIGCWAIDIGHIDSEYEWFLRNAKKRIKIENKHTAEIGNNCDSNCNEEEYLNSILVRIGGIADE